MPEFEQASAEAKIPLDLSALAQTQRRRRTPQRRVATRIPRLLRLTLDINMIAESVDAFQHVRNHPRSQDALGG